MQALVETGNKFQETAFIKADDFLDNENYSLTVFLFEFGLQISCCQNQRVKALAELLFEKKQDLALVDDYWEIVIGAIETLFPSSTIKSWYCEAQNSILIPEGLYVTGIGTDLFEMIYPKQPHESIQLQSLGNQALQVYALPLALASNIKNKFHNVSLQSCFPEVLSSFLLPSSYQEDNQRIWMHLIGQRLYLAVFKDNNLLHFGLNLVEETADVLYFTLLISRELGCDLSKLNVIISHNNMAIDFKDLINMLTLHFGKVQTVEPKGNLIGRLPVTSQTMVKWFLSLNLAQCA